MSEVSIPLVVHATHEAGFKIGGIGAVLQGILSAPSYQQAVARTILAGPVDLSDPLQRERLLAPQNRLELLYSSVYGVDHLPPDQSEAFQQIEREEGVTILYGLRSYGAAQCEVLLVDPSRVNREHVNHFKYHLYLHYGIPSDRYEHVPEYDLYVSAAWPTYRAVRAIVGELDFPGLLVAHEFMGLPLAYAAQMSARERWRLVFYAHEVATARFIIEHHPGHDTMFYNAMELARQKGLYLEDLFGDQSAYYKHALIRTVADHCDHILAVGDRVVDELRFLSPSFEQAPIALAYNGITPFHLTPTERKASFLLLKRYAQNLLGFCPDYVFTHVGRMVLSKAFWRDIRVMEHLDPILAERGQRAVLFVLSTALATGRPGQAIRYMEQDYGWPVAHREGIVTEVSGCPVYDLVGHEVAFYQAIEHFNRHAKASQIVLINQFGWDQEHCGDRMPPEMGFIDLRQGTDLEFGQSIYEPFGIAQLESLPSGAICVLSDVCGNLGLIREAGGGTIPAQVIVGHYTQLDMPLSSPRAVLHIGQADRDRIEAKQAARVAEQIAAILPHTDEDRAKLLAAGQEFAERMRWDYVVSEFLLPVLQRVVASHR